ncbi:diguanylate cyclase [Actinoplanes sp. NPDC049668]|uniref:sensor domain-containing diguanylate cyclase n=1 Tax=unclassified Actinoplanes TaxID=2626549 RepID=UPI0033B07AAB
MSAARCLRVSLLRTVMFVAAFLLVDVLSRAPIAQHTGLHELWPTVGVAALWLVAQRAAPVRWVDPVVLVAATVGLNLALGQTWAVATVCSLIVSVQVGTYLWLLSRPHPGTDGDAGRDGLRRPADLWLQLAAAGGAALSGAAVGLPGLWLATGTFSWPEATTVLICSFTSFLLYGGLAQQVGAVLAVRRARHGSLRAAWRQAVGELTRTRTIEYLAVIGCSLAGYGLALTVPGISMVFPLLVLTVWAAVRLSTIYLMAFSVVVTLVTGASALWESGPFATLASPQAQVLVAHLFAVTSALVGLVVVLSRDERLALTVELAAEKAQALRQAERMEAVVNSLSDGLAVTDADERLVLHNPAMSAVLGRVRTDPKVDPAQFYGFCRLDGTALTDDELPYRQAITDGQTHVMDVLVRNSDVPQGRIVRYTAAPVSDPHGRVHSAVQLLQDVTAERRQRDELADQATRLREQAHHDPLTGLYNRRYADERVPALIEQARAGGMPLTVALVDLDHFKRVNDTLSHPVGDQVLATTAAILRNGTAQITDTGFVARMGGEEFLIVLPDTTPTDAATHLDTLRLAIRNHHWQPVTGDLAVTASMGSTTTASATDPTYSSMLADADRNLYAAKHAGRDRVVNDPPPRPTPRRYRDAPVPSLAA